ncbi:MAG: tetratricopeptide repeat protein [Deltaproteobacteria bacterium]|nr:tetratricopeptide repeat protein [Deltaproteobacteria bacterium]
MAPTTSQHRHALRISALFHGAVVDEVLLQPTALAVRLDDERLGLGFPPLDGAEVAPRVIWRGRAAVDVLMPDAPPIRVTPYEPVELGQGPLRLRLSLNAQHRVLPWTLEADVVFLGTVMLMSALAVALQVFLDSRSVGASVAPDVPPELIARLMRDDLDGAERGAVPTDERPESEVRLRDLFVPAGASGALDHAGGAANVDDEKVVGEGSSAEHQPLRPTPTIDPAAKQPAEVAKLDGVQDAQQLRATPRPSDSDAKDDEPESTAIREGWGLEDWYDAEDARQDQDEILREITETNERLKLNPDDPYLLHHLAYYQYLGRDYDGAKRSYNRLIELFPSMYSSYNNLALVYKRNGEYTKEESFYRLALALEPNNTFVMSNLAVNLAHQERYDEALAIMEKLDSLEPDDPYGDLHRAKIYASRGDAELALTLLDDALAGMQRLDTLHNIEFRQDIRLDPAFRVLREDPRFNDLLVRYYVDGPEPGINLSGGAGG